MTLQSEQAPRFALQGGQLTLVTGSDGLERLIGSLRPDAVEAACRGEAVATVALLGDDGAVVIDACLEHPRPFIVTISSAPHPDVVVVGQMNSLGDCCTVVDWHLTLLSLEEATREKMVTAPPPRLPHAPLVFRCDECAKWSTDGLRYRAAACAMRGLREGGACVVTRFSTTRCRPCRAARRAQSSNDVVTTSQPTPVPGPPRAVATAIAICVTDKSCRARIQQALLASDVEVREVQPEDLQAASASVSHVIADAVGCGLSGLALAETLRRRKFRGSIMLVGPSTHFATAATGAGADYFLWCGVSDVQLRITLYSFIAV